jgi:hypothetical protein
MTTLVERLKARFSADGELDADVRATYLALRRAIGWVVFFTPIVLVGWGLACGIALSSMKTLSDFYWLSPTGHEFAPCRDWLVGSLVAVGMGLIIYRGYSALECWLLNFAGLALIVDALNPTSWPPLYHDQWHIHEIASVTFFLMIALTVWSCGPDTLLDDLDQKTRTRWLWKYRMLASAMAIAPLAALLLATKNARTLWVEVTGVWVFSAYWFVKSHELASVSNIEPGSGPAPRLRRVAGRLQIARPAG